MPRRFDVADLLDITRNAAAANRLPLITQQRAELAELLNQFTDYISQDRSHRAAELRHMAEDTFGRHRRQLENPNDETGWRPVP